MSCAVFGDWCFPSELPLPRNLDHLPNELANFVGVEAPAQNGRQIVPSENNLGVAHIQPTSPLVLPRS